MAKTTLTSGKTRRAFLQDAAAVAALAMVPGVPRGTISASGAAWGAEPLPTPTGAEGLRRLSEHLLVYLGPINVGILRPDTPTARSVT
jgi:hypothetical protein